MEGKKEKSKAQPTLCFDCSKSEFLVQECGCVADEQEELVSAEIENDSGDFDAK